MKILQRLGRCWCPAKYAGAGLIALFLCSVPPVMADDMSVSEVEALKQEMEAMKQEIAELRGLLKQQASETASKQDVETLKQDVAETRQVQSEWKNTESGFHAAGYGAAGYVDSQDENGSFGMLSFNPIFHYQYKDLFLLEAELELELTDDGETETKLEYSSIDWFINDYMTLVAGKFLSPLGYLRQNLHPAWINKFASLPPGFGEDGAAPEAEIGAQLRGGFHVGNPKVNYAVYVGNGPELESDGERIRAVTTDGFLRDVDNHKVFGGRVGVLPIPHLEIGLSGATGKAAVTKDEEDGEVEDQPARSYSALGADISYQYGSKLDLRAEYMQQKVGSVSPAKTDYGNNSGTWRTWYAQAAYKFLPSKWEAVLRYTDFNSPVDSDDQKQWGFGVNYLFASNAMAKLDYELNDGQSGEPSNADRWLLQMAYGF